MRIVRREDLRILRLVAIVISSGLIFSIVIFRIPADELPSTAWLPTGLLLVLVHLSCIIFYDKLAKIPGIRLIEFVVIQAIAFAVLVCAGWALGYFAHWQLPMALWQLVAVVVIINLVGLVWFFVMQRAYRPRYGLMPSPLARPLRRLGDIDAVDVRPDRRLQDQGVTILVLDPLASPPPEHMHHLTEAIVNGISIVSSVDLYERITGRTPIRQLKGLANDFTLSIHRNYDRPKWLVDFVLSAFLILIMLVPFALIALLIRLDSPGPALFRQVRIGRNGRRFTILKFRTLYEHACAAGPVDGGTRHDDMTRIGRLLRRTRLDELPQLFNVLRGDMSLIGPRPEWDELAIQLRRELSLYNFRNITRPGISGWAQVNYRYANTVKTTRRKLEYDIYYNRHRSFELDMLILVRTLFVVLGARGA